MVLFFKGMAEEWRLTSYGLDVSDQLRVRNPKTKKVLKPRIGTAGYLQIVWRVNGRKRTVLLHQLVADAFLTKPKKYDCIDHIDQNKLNNHWTNLRYCSRADNQKNRGKTKKNTSGENGVSWNKKNKAWCAKWYENGKQIHKSFSIGKYGDEAKNMALAHRIAKEKELGGFPPREAPIINNITINNYFAAAEQSKE